MVGLGVPGEPRKKTSYFPLNPGCSIGIFLRVYYNPHITGQYNPLTQPTMVFFRASHGYWKKVGEDLKGTLPETKIRQFAPENG